MPTTGAGQTLMLGRHQRAVEAAIASLGKRRFAERFLEKDPTLWKDDPAHARVIRNRMGWMEAAGRLLERIGGVEAFAGEVRSAGFRHVVLLGMGGSSLCPDVLRRTFRRGRGFPALVVLDSTDPEAIARVSSAIDASRTLFIVASKSGTTIESQMLCRYFGDKAAGSSFAAITDAGTPLQDLARAQGFRRVFTNPADIGGRYSALSYFGMVPAACAGIDVARVLKRGAGMAALVDPARSPGQCPPIVLGAALAALAAAGRDKVTFATSPRIASFGYWVEQLIAESTGKEGKGIVPIEGEPLAAPAGYGRDRVFVHLKVRGERQAAAGRRLAALRRAGHPCIAIQLRDLYDIGAEFNRWAIATAAAGSLLGIDPFDEPNVKESKDNTARVLDRYGSEGGLPRVLPDFVENGIQGWSTIRPRGRTGRSTLRGALDSLCRSVRAGDYVAIMAYLRMDEATQRRLDAIRVALRDRSRAATTVGYGPRFLHSTGQLHKGGAGNGVFLQITADKVIDLPIPGEAFSFGVLQAAQAAGDHQSLVGRGYRVLRLHLGGDRLGGLDTLIRTLAMASR